MSERFASSADWRPFLERVSGSVVRERGVFEEDLPPRAAETGWLGTDGASAEEIADAEKRLGVTLPPGYRAFLETTNGFGPVGLFVRRLRPAHELSWLRDEDPEMVSAWAEGTGDPATETQLGQLLVVSDEYDDARLLLNPAVMSKDGEWEAWFFAHWGDSQHESFRTLVEDLHRRLVDQLKADRGEPTPHVSSALGIAADDLDGLVHALRDSDAGRRAAALRAIGNLRNPAAAPAVVAVLQDANEDDYVRETATRTLGQLRDERSVAALVDVLRLPYPQGRMFDPERRSAAQERTIALKHAARQGLLAPPVEQLARDALATALRDADPFLRAEACQVLCYAWRWSPDAFELVAPLVRDPDPEVRLALVTHAGQLGEPGIELLGAARNDEDPRVRARAQHVLEWLDPS